MTHEIVFIKIIQFLHSPWSASVSNDMISMESSMSLELKSTGGNFTCICLNKLNLYVSCDDARNA